MAFDDLPPGVSPEDCDPDRHEPKPDPDRHYEARVEQEITREIEGECEQPEADR
jgi:hypothetical protein